MDYRDILAMRGFTPKPIERSSDTARAGQHLIDRNRVITFKPHPDAPASANHHAAAGSGSVITGGR